MGFPVLVWLLAGASTGWISSRVLATHEEQNTLSYVLVGAIGALLGGFITRILMGQAMSEWGMASTLISLISAIVMLFFIRQRLNQGDETD